MSLRCSPAWQEGCRVSKGQGEDHDARTVAAGRQVTLPVDLRHKLKLAQGDYLEAELVEDGVLLKPVLAAQRERALEEMFAAKARVRPKPEQAKKSPDQQEQEICEEVSAMRREYAQGRHR